MSTINLVKIYFLPGIRKSLTPEKVRQYIAIAYQTASDLKLHPKEILIR